jgi:hypothetical protein
MRVKVPDEGVAAGTSAGVGRTGVANAVCTIRGVGVGRGVGVSNTTWGVGLLGTVEVGVANPTRGVGLGGTGVAVVLGSADRDPQLARSKAETTNGMNIE